VPALIFTAEVLEQAREAPEPPTPLLLQWAGASGDAGERLREQLERAAALVPEEQRARVLGPLSLRSTDDQVRTAAGGLLLAKTLSELGWSVLYEPTIGTQTPDLLVRKNGAEYVVEVRRVLGRYEIDTRSFLVVQRALSAIRTKTPLHLVHLDVDGAASLKRFAAHVAEVLAGPIPAGVHRFSSPGVNIAYSIEPTELEEPGPAVFSWQPPMIYGDDADLVEAAINEKLRAYKQPIIVALDLVGVAGGFDAVRDAFYGARPIVEPIDLTGTGRAGNARLGPMQNGMLVGRDRNAQRARERLIAVLPFSWGIGRSTEAFEVSAQLLANPATEPPHAFPEFAPIPRFLFSERQAADTIMMRWEPPADPTSWSHVP